MKILLIIVAIIAILVLSFFATNTSVNDEFNTKLALRARIITFWVSIFIAFFVGYFMN